MFRKVFTAVILTACALIASSQPWMQAPYLQVQESEADFKDIKNAYEMLLSEFDKESDIPGYKQFRRWESIWEHHVYPTGQLPPADLYWNAKQSFQGVAQPESSHNGTWIPLGITNWTNGMSGYNPGVGRVNTVEVDPKNPNIIFIGSPSGGIWKTTDGGQTWNTSYDDMPALGVSAIAIHPQNTDTIFIGTGDRDAGDSRSIGIYVSHDGGASWQTTGFSSSPNSQRINKILINELNPNSMIAAGWNGIYKSLDGGANWSQVYTGPEIKNVIYRPGDTSTVYAVNKSFFRSLDGGLNFMEIIAGIAHDTARMEISVSAADPNMVYVLATRTTNRFGAFYCSTDSGTTFRQMSLTPNILGYAMGGNDTKGQGWYDLAVAAHPDYPHMVFSGGVNVWMSADTGKTWSIRSHWVYDLDNKDEYTHADIHYLGFHGSRLFCGSDGGVFYSTNNGIKFTDITAGLGITQFYRLGMFPKNPDWMLAGAQDNGSNIYNQGNWTHAYGADGMEAACDPLDSFIVYVSSQNGGIRRSDDAGENFTSIRPQNDPSGGWVTPYTIHPKYPERVVAGYNKIYLSRNYGDDFYAISHFLAGGSTLHNVAQAPSDTGTIYASRYGSFYITRNSGDTWTPKVPVSNASITGIAVDNLNADRIWISVTGSSGGSDGVYHSTDGGNTWTSLTKNLTSLGFNHIVQVEGTHDALYLATEVGVYYTDTTLSGWIAFNDDLPNVRVRELEVNYPAQIIRAATYGRGIWESYLYGTAQSIAEGQEIEASLYPNPAGYSATLVLPGISEEIQVELFSASGSHIRSLQAGRLIGDRIEISRAGLPPGMYFIRITEGTKLKVLKIVFE